MKIKALTLLVLAASLSSCSRMKAGWAEANKPAVYGAYGPYDIYKSPLASPYLFGGSSGMTQPLRHLRP